MNPMLTSFLPQGLAVPPALRSAPAPQIAHQGVHFASARNPQADVFVRRNAALPRFSGDGVELGHANTIMDDEGTTWIHYAALAGDLDVANKLVKQSNVDFEQKNLKGLTPLTVCAATGKLDVAKLYRKHGAKLQVIYQKDAKGDIDYSKKFIKPSDLAKKHSKDPATIQYFLNEEKDEMDKLLSKK